MTLEEYAVKKIEELEGEVADLKESLEKAQEELENKDRLLEGAKKFVSASFSLSPRNEQWDTEATLERISFDMSKPSLKTYDDGFGKESYFKTRDLLLDLGMKVDEGYEPIKEE